MATKKKSTKKKSKAKTGKKKATTKKKGKSASQVTSEKMLKKYGTLKAMLNEQADLEVAIKQVARLNARQAREELKRQTNAIAEKFGVKKSSLKPKRRKKTT
jgi:hypothetical protein